MDSIYLSEEAFYNGQRTIVVKKLKFKYNWWIIEAASTRLLQRVIKSR